MVELIALVALCVLAFLAGAGVFAAGFAVGVRTVARPHVTTMTTEPTAVEEAGVDDKTSAAVEEVLREWFHGET